MTTGIDDWRPSDTVAARVIDAFREDRPLAEVAGGDYWPMVLRSWAGWRREIPHPGQHGEPRRCSRRVEALVIRAASHHDGLCRHRRRRGSGSLPHARRSRGPCAPLTSRPPAHSRPGSPDSDPGYGQVTATLTAGSRIAP